MFSTAKQKVILGIYVFLLLSIPAGAYLASQQQTVTSKAQTPQPQKTVSIKPKVNPLDEIKNLSSTGSSTLDTLIEELDTPAITFGPTLNLKLTLEGRPIGNMASRVFIGISEGTTPVINPKYLLSFTIDLPDSGIFEGLSLSGLNSGGSYLAYIKPTVQIATSSAFIMSPAVTSLNNGNPITLLTGDLNQDNVINSADYSIAKSALSATPTSSNWNKEADFNLDNVINAIDLGFIFKNYTKTGESGVWTSTPTATSSGIPSNVGTATPSGHPTGEGYWLWVPSLD